MVRLHTGSNKVESRRGLLNGEYLKRETTRTELQSELRQGRHWAVEMRSYGKQEMVMEGQTTGGESRQDHVPSTILPSKVIFE